MNMEYILKNHPNQVFASTFEIELDLGKIAHLRLVISSENRYYSLGIVNSLESNVNTCVDRSFCRGWFFSLGVTYHLEYFETRHMLTQPLPSFEVDSMVGFQLGHTESPSVDDQKVYGEHRPDDIPNPSTLPHQPFPY